MTVLAAGRIRIRSVAAGCILALVTFTAAFYRDFSYLSVPLGPLRLYVTEIVLAGVVASIALIAMTTKVLHFRTGVASLPVAMFILWGALCLFRGREFGILSLREFATNYYGLFYLLIPLLLLSERSMKLLALAILIGTAIAAAVVVGRVLTGFGTVTSTGAVRYHPSIGVGASFALFWFLGAPSPTYGRKIVNGLGALASVVLVVVATQHRSAALALACALGLWLLVLHRGRGVGAIGSRSLTIGLLVIAGLVIAIDSQVAMNTVNRLRALKGGPDEYNAVWRLYVWNLLLQGVTESPLFGHGFGANLPAFVFRGLRYGFDPNAPIGAHNSYLFVLYKEGLVGVGLLFAYMVTVTAYLVRRIGTVRDGGARWIAGAGTAAFTFVAVFAAFNVVLEGPFMGMFFWIYPALSEGILRTSGAGTSGA